MGGSSSSSLTEVEGFQIGRLLPNSPAHVSGLCTFFDIITGINNIALDESSVEFFKSQVLNNKGKTIILTIFNLRLCIYRDVELTPSDEWGGVGLLGCEIEWNSAERAMKSTWHIVDIHNDSPVRTNAHIMSHRDFIIGMQHPDEQVVTLFNQSSFTEKLEGWREAYANNSASIPATLLLLIFDSVDNAVKEVLVDMGGSLSLGIDIADGYLHYIPTITVVDPAEAAGKLPYMKKFFVSETTHILDDVGVSNIVISPTHQSEEEVPTFVQVATDKDIFVSALPFPSFPLPITVSR